MFEYSASRSNIINWVYSQVDYQPGVLFPRKKGWEFYLKSVYPGGYQYSLFLTVVSDGNESIIFFPIDDLPYERDIPGIFNNEFLKEITRDLKLSIHKTQLILITAEKNESRVVTVVKKNKVNCSVLIHRYDKAEFAVGGFTNPRLEYRLSRHQFDPDTVTGYLVTNQFLFGDRGQKLFFLQTLFHKMDQAWVSGRKTISIRELVSDTLPNWKQYRRSEQREILNTVETELAEVCHRFFDGWTSLRQISKSAKSNPEAGIILPTAPKTRKNLNIWTRGQKLALEYLCHHVEPIVIDVKDFKSI